MTLRRKLIFAGAAAGLILVLVFVVRALGTDPDPLRSRRVLTLFMIVAALAAAFAPLCGADRAAPRCRLGALRAVGEPLGWTLAVFLPGTLILALFFDRGGLVPWLLALVVALGAGLASAGLILALARPGNRPRLGVCVALALLLLFEFQPLYTYSLIKTFNGRPRAQSVLLAAGVRTSWMGTAYAMKDNLFGYDLTSPTLYPPHWPGTDYPVSRPGPGRHFFEYLTAFALLATIGLVRAGPVAIEPKEGTGEGAEDPPDDKGTPNE
ncbi:MAG: hypothetical protein ACYTGB_12035 [Planctomycetota bacterium]